MWQLCMEVSKLMCIAKFAKSRREGSGDQKRGRWGACVCMCVRECTREPKVRFRTCVYERRVRDECLKSLCGAREPSTNGWTSHLCSVLHVCDVRLPPPKLLAMCENRVDAEGRLPRCGALVATSGRSNPTKLKLREDEVP